MNVLGLSIQVPCRYLYLSDAKSCSYLTGKQELSFKKIRLKDIGLKYLESALLVQVIKSLGKNSLNSVKRKQVSAYFGAKVGERILKNARYITIWVYEEIKRIFKERK